MSETRTFTQSDLKTAVAVGVHRDRARIAAICNLPEASGREAEALLIATTTDLTVDAARAQLACVPKAPAAAEAVDTPVDTDPPTETSTPVGETADATAMWEASLASRGIPIHGTPAAADTSALWSASLASRGMAVGGEQ